MASGIIRAICSIERRKKQKLKKISFIPTRKDVTLSQILVKEGWKSYMLYLLMYKWYEEEIVAKRKYFFVFEPWMSTTDSLPNNNDLDNSTSLSAIFPFFRLFTQKIFPLLAFLFLGLYAFTNTVHGQNNITAHIESIPNNKNVKSKLTLTEITTGEKITVRTDSTTKNLLYNPNIPEGIYKRKIETENHFLFLDTININNNTEMNIQQIENIGKTSTFMPADTTTYSSKYYKTIAGIFKILTRTKDPPLRPPEDPQNIIKWVNYKNVRLYANNTTMPAGWRAGFDRVINDVKTKTDNKITFREEQTDSTGGIRFIFCPTMQIPGAGAGSNGYTITHKNGFKIYQKNCYIATDLNDINTYESVVTREMGRALGLESFSSDITFVMYEYATQNKVFHLDEGKVMQILATINIGTYMRPYLHNSTASNINWPAEKTVNINNLTIFEGADETFLTKLSYHFKDPENGSLTYNTSGENITTSIRNDSLFIKPLAGFYGNIELIVKATDDQGQSAEPDTVNITVNHINHAPTASILTNPAEGDTIITKDYTVKWTPSIDPENDPIIYNLIITGTKDTTIAGITDTSYQITNLREKLPIGNYTGKIETSDGINTTVSQINNFYISTITSIEDEIDNKPNKFTLTQNYPNPFNPSTVISYSIPTDVRGEMQEVRLMVYDILGSEIATLVNENQKAGNYKVIFNASHLPTGLYIYRLTSGSFTKSMKMLLIK